VRKIDTTKVTPSAYLGVLGLTGLSAYFPCRDIGKPQAGETAFISGAAGAVGSTAGQILKNSGCKVFGSAGTAEKLTYLTEDLGFDGALNYKVSDEELDRQIGELCPDGVSEAALVHPCVHAAVHGGGT
jgi:NADPH-dependent curcumin reductase CurA